MELSERDILIVTVLGYNGELKDYKIYHWFKETFEVDTMIFRKPNGNFIIYINKNKKNILCRTFKFYPGISLKLRLIMRLFIVDKENNILGPSESYYYLKDEERWQF